MKKVWGRVKASEPLFEEQSDAVKVSETLNDSHRKAVGRGKNKNIEMARIRKLSPLVGESVNRQVDERGKFEQTRISGLYRTV